MIALIVRRENFAQTTLLLQFQDSVMLVITVLRRLKLLSLLQKLQESMGCVHVENTVLLKAPQLLIVQKESLEVARVQKAKANARIALRAIYVTQLEWVFWTNLLNVRLIKNALPVLRDKHPAQLIIHTAQRALLFKLRVLMDIKEQQEVPLLFVLSVLEAIFAVSELKMIVQKDTTALLEVQLQYLVKPESITAIWINLNQVLA